MALPLAKAFGRSRENWLGMQDNYDLYQARQHIRLTNVRKVRLKTAKPMDSAKTVLKVAKRVYCTFLMEV